MLESNCLELEPIILSLKAIILRLKVIVLSLKAIILSLKFIILSNHPELQSNHPEHQAGGGRDGGGVRPASRAHQALGPRYEWRGRCGPSQEESSLLTIYWSQHQGLVTPSDHAMTGVVDAVRLKKRVRYCQSS